NNMKKICLLIPFCLVYIFTQAQGYDTAFGLRLGTEWGATFKQRVAKRTTGEFMVQHSNKREETTFTLLGEQHFPLLVRNFNVYGGAGLHAGFISNPNDDPDLKNPVGLTMIGGAELSVGKINVSWDIKPSVNVVGGQNRVYAHTGVSVRYIIDKRELIRKRSDGEKARAKRKRGRAKEKRKKKRAKEKEKRKKTGGIRLPKISL
ncbi:MAG: hypothetical protein AAGI49_09585, partial [Bacteroidota bacterium]